MLVLGIMSGTSLDGADYALCKISASKCDLVKHWKAAFPPLLAKSLSAAARGDATSWELAQLHHDLGRFYVQGSRNGRKLKPELIGLHGQTIFHNPDPRRRATLQIGEPSYLAARHHVPVISNFRAADIAAGGQGAPLATLFHVRAFGRRGRHICVNNLGGISNVTSIAWRRGSKPRVQAFDTGPANMLIDLAMRSLTRNKECLDRGGRWAAKGDANDRLIAEWLKHPYFHQPPPKSTGREQFGEPFLNHALHSMKGMPPSDVMATLTRFTARSIALNYSLHLAGSPDTVVLAGGGAANRTLVAEIFMELSKTNPSMNVVVSDQFGWPCQTIEASAFAFLAYRRYHGLPGNLPETTGARKNALLGQIAAAI